MKRSIGTFYTLPFTAAFLCWMAFIPSLLAETIPYNISYLQLAGQQGGAAAVKVNNHRQVAFIRQGTDSIFAGVYSFDTTNGYEVGYHETEHVPSPDFARSQRSHKS